MPYVQRIDGTVTGIFAQPQPGIAEEFLADDHAEVAAFNTPVLTASPLQVRRILRSMNRLAEVEAMVAQADDAVKDAWNYASEFRSDSPTIAALAANLNPPLSSGDIYNLFLAARALPPL